MRRYCGQVGKSIHYFLPTSLKKWRDQSLRIASDRGRLTVIPGDSVRWKMESDFIKFVNTSLGFF